MGECFSAELNEHGLSLHMYRILAALDEKQELSLGELSTMVSCEISTLSRQVTTLQKKGLLTRRRLDGNGRCVSIRLSADGAVLFKQLEPRARFWETAAIAGFTSEEIAQLKTQLIKIYASLDRYHLQEGTRHKDNAIIYSKET